MHFLICRENSFEHWFSLCTESGDKLLARINVWRAIRSLRVGLDAIP